MNIFQAIFLYALLILPTTLLFAQNLPITKHSYHQQIDNEETVFTWTMEQGEYFTLKTVEPLETTSLRCTKNGDVLEWNLQRGEHTLITATRKGNMILVEGIMNGETVEMRFTIDDKPWYQFLSFSLQSFLKDNNIQHTQFWILSPRHLEMYMMEALKEGEEAVTLNGRATEAIKVRVAPDGIVGKLFYGHYWYRKPDFLWIKYQGDHGPLSPETIIHLQQENLH